MEGLKKYEDKVEELKEQVAEIQNLNDKVENLKSMVSALQELVRELINQAGISGSIAS